MVDRDVRAGIGYARCGRPNIREETAESVVSTFFRIVEDSFSLFEWSQQYGLHAYGYIKRRVKTL